VAYLPKYYYKPIVEKVEEIYFENAKKDFFQNGRFDLNATVVVEAENEDEALKIRMGITDIRMWVLDHVES
jgi:hypothetical protein